MALIRRCDNCRKEGSPPKMFSAETDDWYTLYKSGEEGLNFCTIKCVQEYFTAQRMIEGITD